MTAPAPQGSNVHLAFHADELAYLRARAAAEERSVPWVVRRLVRAAMGGRPSEPLGDHPCGLKRIPFEAKP